MVLYPKDLGIYLSTDAKAIHVNLPKKYMAVILEIE